ncbi:MAG: preprotein translocase subunit SecG [Planctomycetes bacterium]|nr:preprotein translocase subunit SecG [Planctomycetota bacterium]
MTTTTLILVILLWPLCLFIIGMILLQGGAGDLSSSFGGGGQLDSTLGVGAGRKMSKITGWLGGSFLLIVTILSIHHDGDLGAAAGAKGGVVPTTVTPTDFGAQTGTTTGAGKAVVPAAATDAAKPGVAAVPAVAKPADGAPAPAVPATAPAIAPAVVPAAPAPAPEAPKAPSAPALVPEAPAPAPTAAAPAPAEAAPAHSGVQLEPK